MYLAMWELAQLQKQTNAKVCHQACQLPGLPQTTGSTDAESTGLVMIVGSQVLAKGAETHAPASD